MVDSDSKASIELSFPSLISRVRKGDQRAADKLVREYEPHIRRVLRVKFTDTALRRQMDSVDICQSVMADFFVRTALGQFQLDNPAQLIKLLATMARNKLINRAEEQRAQKRDIRRTDVAAADEMEIDGNHATPSRIASGRELLHLVRTRLTKEERYLAEERAKGRSWAELSEELGAPADTLRMRFTRAMDRISEELNLESFRG